MPNKDKLTQDRELDEILRLYLKKVVDAAFENHSGRIVEFAERSKAQRDKTKAELELYINREIVSELESLNHEPQMHGDWQAVIDQRIAKYKEEDKVIRNSVKISKVEHKPLPKNIEPLREEDK